MRIIGCKGNLDTWMAGRHAKLIEYVYGSVDFHSLFPSAIDRDYEGETLPSECSRTDRYTYNDIGGRGGTAYGRLLYPVAQPNGILFIFWCGHSGIYNTEPDLGVINYFLQRGCHVLALELPVTGYNGSSITLTVAGESTVIEADQGMYHPFSALDLDGGPNSTRVWQDMLFMSLNQAILDVSPTFIANSGHSGGGMQTELSAALDHRIRASYSIFGSAWWPWPHYDFQSGTNDWDTAATNKLFRPSNAGDKLTRHALSAWGGRRAMKIVADLDSVFPTLNKHQGVTLGEQEIKRMINGNGSFDVVYDPDATWHMTIEWSHAAIWNDMQNYLP